MEMEMEKKHWTEYRWDEGIAILHNHPDYQDEMNMEIECISWRLAEYVVAVYI